MQPNAATVVVQLVSHGFVVTLTQESDIQKADRTNKKRHSRRHFAGVRDWNLLRFDAQSHSGFN
jgi:hypothetical protein